jgi:predicted exporter
VPVESLRRFRWLALLPVAAAALFLILRGGPDWEDDLQSLSPVPAASRALDAELRGELGAAEVSQLLIVQGPDAETVLRRQEALLPLLDRLTAEGVLAGADLAARVLPSVGRQEARQAKLPPPDVLAERLASASAGLPFRPDAFAPFLAAAETSRTLTPLRPRDLAGTPLAARLEPLLYARDGIWHGPVALRGLRDQERLRAALAEWTAERAVDDGSPAEAGGASATAASRRADAAADAVRSVLFVDMRQELGLILSGYTAQAWRWAGWSALAVLLVLAIGLRRPGMVLRVLGAVASAILVAAAALTLAGTRLSLIHLVALQLVAGVSLDYALFFARRLLDEEERARTLRTLVTCNAMTLLTFGLLALCRTPLLRDIGETVAVGAVLGMGFGFLFAGEAPRRLR